MAKKLKMVDDWDIETGRKGPKEGDILTVDEEILDDHGNVDYWLVLFNGEFYEVYPYEVEEIE
ncbi:hypothetical protein KASHIRA_01020 [Serratia phage vB_SmaM-Kashira]|nr:hypothetical protein KASHIRA_01020 [Serratia phage vB_SmaM-Kashira]